MTTATSTYRYETITPDNLSASDLIAEAAAATELVECACVRIDNKAECANVLFFPSIGRAGIAWGADASWTDCSSIEDAIERYLGIDGKEMCE